MIQIEIFPHRRAAERVEYGSGPHILLAWFGLPIGALLRASRYLEMGAILPTGEASAGNKESGR